MNAQLEIGRAHSRAEDAHLAARELHAALARPDMGLVIFFCSNRYDLDELASEMAQLFGDVPLVGCTTAGEIGPVGYSEHGLSGVCFPAGLCSAVIGQVDDLQRFAMADGQAFVQEQLQRLEAKAPQAAWGNSFAFLMIDGLSVREEPVVHALQNALGRIPLVGGSAGDDLQFGETRVYHDGRFHTGSAVMVLATTPLPFMTFKTQHFVPGEERLVVTEANPGERIVYEIDGYPATDEYARLVNVPADDLAPDRFAASPVVVVIDGTDYVRSIQKANPDKSLTFYCAIEEGVVLRVARGVDLVDNLQHRLQSITDKLGPPQLVLACDCVLRRLEIRQRGLEKEVGRLLNEHRVVGFNTYGEQFGGVHVNQTLVGIAFGQVSE